MLDFRPLRVPAFVGASFVATAFPFMLAGILWPEGLHANAAFFFWPAAGVNLGLALLWSKRLCLLIPLNGLLAVLLLRQPLLPSITGALLNMAEAWIAATLLAAAPPLSRQLDRPRTVLRLAAVSLLTGLLTGTGYTGILVSIGAVPAARAGASILSTAMANACGVMFLTPLILSLDRTRAHPTGSLRRHALWLPLALATGTLAFSGVYSNSINYVFLVFPLMMFAAATQPFSLLPRMLCVLMATVYLALGLHAGKFPSSQTTEIIWFLQAAGWTLAATSLLLGALIAEIRRQEAALRQHEQDLLEGKLMLEREQLRTLRYQITPHFLFNSLNSIYAVIPPALSVPRQMLLALASFFRSTLEPADRDLIPLHREIKRLQEYLQIETTRFGEDLHTAFHIDPGLHDQPVPPFLLQPLAENALKHGLEKNPGPFHLTLTAQPEPGNFFSVEVANTAPWFPAADPGHPGFGLENVRKRIRLASANRGSLDILADAHTTRVRVRLPLNIPAPETP